MLASYLPELISVITKFRPWIKNLLKELSLEQLIDSYAL